MYKKIFDKYHLIKIFCFIMLPYKQWFFILTSNLLFTTTVCNERVPKHTNKKLNTIEGVAWKLQRIFDNLTIHCNFYCDLFDNLTLITDLKSIDILLKNYRKKMFAVCWCSWIHLIDSYLLVQEPTTYWGFRYGRGSVFPSTSYLSCFFPLDLEHGLRTHDG